MTGRRLCGGCRHETGSLRSGPHGRGFDQFALLGIENFDAVCGMSSGSGRNQTVGSAGGIGQDEGAVSFRGRGRNELSILVQRDAFGWNGDFIAALGYDDLPGYGVVRTAQHAKAAGGDYLIFVQGRQLSRSIAGGGGRLQVGSDFFRLDDRQGDLDSPARRAGCGACDENGDGGIQRSDRCTRKAVGSDDKCGQPFTNGREDDTSRIVGTLFDSGCTRLNQRDQQLPIRIGGDLPARLQRNAQRATLQIRHKILAQFPPFALVQINNRGPVPHGHWLLLRLLGVARLHCDTGQHGRTKRLDDSVVFKSTQHR
ncbi:MAG: hypothetical protein D6753_07975 [Planctomycetota bacterium]|nr:MAG: hypothetical protein D6753_07975 [Planctomycetota bacterium]